MSLSAVIVDDEQLARDELAFLLKNVDDVDVVAQGKNGVEGVGLIREHNPDLVFLDVQMPGLDGFGVIKKLLDRKVALPKIVFCTAFDQYAVKAFEVNAVDYLLKPFDKKRVAQSVAQSTSQNRGQRHTVRQTRHADAHAGVTEAANFQDSAESCRPVIPGESERHLFRFHRRRRYHSGHQRCERHGRSIQLPYAGRIAGQPRSESFLAGASFIPGKYQSD